MTSASQRHPTGLGLVASFVAALGVGGVAAALVGAVVASGADQGQQDEALHFGEAQGAMAVVAIVVGAAAGVAAFVLVHHLARRGLLREPEIGPGGVGQDDAAPEP